MIVEYITHMGDDLMVVNAARVSFDKTSQYEYINIMEPNETGGRDLASIKRISDKDAKLINYLAKHNHFSPFTHPQIQVRVVAPIFIANQLKRHQVGLSINEVSRRYVDDEPTFYIPDKWRGRPSGSIKQGSSDEEIHGYNSSYRNSIENCKDLYLYMIATGVCPEQARMVLPQSMNTSWIWTGSLLAFIRIYNQRIDSHSQLESQMIAKQLGEILEERFPVSFKAWKDQA